MKPRTQQNIYKERNPRDMEKNEGIMSVFNRYSLRTTFGIARNAKQGKYGHWALTLSVPELLCYFTILVVIHLHNLAYFDTFIHIRTVSNQRPGKSHVHHRDRDVGTQVGTGGDNSKEL